MMDEILDDDLFLGLLAANPRQEVASTKAETAVHAGPWHDSLQADGIQAFLATTPPGSYGSASTCQQPAMWMPAPIDSWKRAGAFSHSPPLAQEFMALPTTRLATRSLDRGEPSAHVPGLGAHITSSTARSLMHTTSTGRSTASTLTTALEPHPGWAGWLPGLMTEGCYPACAAVDLASAPAPAAESPQSSGDGPGSSGQRGRSSGQQGANSSGSPSAANAGKSFKEVHAERNKQAQRRFRQRQKVRAWGCWLHVIAVGVTHCTMD